MTFRDKRAFWNEWMLTSFFSCVTCVQGGGNAGHTVVVGDQQYYFGMLPSGMITENCMNVIGE